ncbi:hypothetical protein MJH12_04635 [bacterium]|nr:hypothetical protein [bacterium]
MKILLSLLTISLAFILSACVQTMEDNSIAITKSEFLMGPKGKKLKFDLGIKTGKDQFAVLITKKTRVPTGSAFQMKAAKDQTKPLVQIAYLKSEDPKEVVAIASVEISALDKNQKLDRLKLNLTVINGLIRLDAKSVGSNVILTLNVIHRNEK